MVFCLMAVDIQKNTNNLQPYSTGLNTINDPIQSHDYDDFIFKQVIKDSVY